MNKVYHIVQNILVKPFGKALKVVLFKVHPAIIFSTILLITIFWASFIPSLKFNYDIESFFSSKDPEVGYYYKYRDTFENENDFVLVGIRNKEGVFQKKFLGQLDEISNELKNLPGIKKVFSPTNLNEAIKGPMGIIRIPLIHVDKPNKYNSDSKKVYASGIYTGSFFGSDKQTVSLLIKKDGKLSRQENDKLLLSINGVLSSHEFDEFHIAGRIRTQHYYVNRMKSQMGLFAALAGFLFIGSLFIIFKCMRYVTLSLGAVLLSLVWIFGIMGWLGIQLDLMLTLLPTLIFVISTSSSIHLITRFRNEYKVGVPKDTAIRISIIETGVPNFLNAFTTAIGFASLVMIPVIPIQRFGLFTAAGILISFFINLLFVPTAMKVLHIKPSANKPSVKGEKNKGKLVNLIFNRPKLILGAYAIAILAGGYFTFNLKINNHFLDDLDPTCNLKKDLDFFEQNFSGIRPFEMSIYAKSGNTILDYKMLQEMDKVENYLKNDYKVGFLFSPLSFIKSINKAIHGGSQKYYRIPDSQVELERVMKLADKQKIWDRFLPVVTKDKSTGRITGRTADVGSNIFKVRNENLQTFLNQNTQYLNYRITGAAHLMDNANNHIAWSLIKGILLAIAVATLVIGLFTKSWKLAAISLVPNVIPLLLASGFMGVAGIPLKVTTSLIFTIVYGIALDDTIHFLNSYRLKKKIFTDVNEAVKETISKMWRPMLFTSVVLFSGFMIFPLSDFSSISTLGILISGSLLVALLTDLLLLPVLLTKSFRHLFVMKPLTPLTDHKEQNIVQDLPNLVLEDRPAIQRKMVSKFPFVKSHMN